MAGRRHHFIQQHLSRGFAVDHESRPALVWVYRRGTEKPFLESTEHYGFERDFYGKPSDTTVDDIITNAEREEFSPFIDALRTEQLGVEIDSKAAARYVQHLFFRSKHLRSVFSEALSAMTETFAVEVLKYDRLAPFLRELIVRHIDQIALKAEQSQKRPLTELERQAVTTLLQQNVSALVDQFIAEKRSEIEQALASFMKLLPRMVAEGHERSLRNGFSNANGPREQAMREMHWRVLSSDVPLVLGDSCAFSELASGEFLPLPDAKMKGLRLYVPLSTYRYLVGCESRCESEGLRVRQGAVTCSYESFCASADSQDFRNLRAAIGSTAMPVSKAELEQMALKGIEDTLEKQLSEGFN